MGWDCESKSVVLNHPDTACLTTKGVVTHRLRSAGLSAHWHQPWVYQFNDICTNISSLLFRVYKELSMFLARQETCEGNPIVPIFREVIEA